MLVIGRPELVLNHHATAAIVTGHNVRPKPPNSHFSALEGQRKIEALAQ